MSDNPFGDFIRQRRQDARLTRTELAKRANLSASLIEKVEMGTRPTTLPTMQILFDQLKVPALYRRHILRLTYPGLFDGQRTDASSPEPLLEDIGELDHLRDPACYFTLPTFVIIEANNAYKQTFPGVRLGASFIEWMFLTPAARNVMVEWEKEAHRIIHAMRILTPNLSRDVRVAKIMHRCSQAPDWETLWNSPPPSIHTRPGPIRIRNLTECQDRSLAPHIYSPELPTRPGWLLCLCLVLQ